MDTIDVAGVGHDLNRNVQSLTGDATINKDLITIDHASRENDIDYNIDNMRLVLSEES